LRAVAQPYPSDILGTRDRRRRRSCGAASQRYYRSCGTDIHREASIRVPLRFYYRVQGRVKNQTRTPTAPIARTRNTKSNITCASSLLETEMPKRSHRSSFPELRTGCGRLFDCIVKNGWHGCPRVRSRDYAALASCPGTTTSGSRTICSAESGTLGMTARLSPAAVVLAHGHPPSQPSAEA